MGNGAKPSFTLPILTRIPSVRSAEGRSLPAPLPKSGEPQRGPVLVRRQDVAPKDIQAVMERPQKAVVINSEDFIDFYISNSKQTASVLQGKLIGENVARDAYRGYAPYIKGIAAKGDGSQIEDFLTHAFASDKNLHDSAVDILNQTLVTQYQRMAPITLEQIRCGLSDASDLIGFARRFRCPVLACSGKDLLLLGITNPTIGASLAVSLVEKFPEYAKAKIDFLILTQEEMVQACQLNSNTAAPEAA